MLDFGHDVVVVEIIEESVRTHHQDVIVLNHVPLVVTLTWAVGKSIGTELERKVPSMMLLFRPENNL